MSCLGGDGMWEFHILRVFSPAPFHSQVTLDPASRQSSRKGKQVWTLHQAVAWEIKGPKAHQTRTQPHPPGPHSVTPGPSLFSSVQPLTTHNSSTLTSPGSTFIC